MNNFEFHNPTRIYFGTGQIEQLDTIVPRDAKTLLLYGGGSIKKNNVYSQVISALGKRKVVEFGGIEPNPTYETLMKAVELARREDVTFLLAVGGGSVLDGTKLIAVAIPFEGDPWKILVPGEKPTEAVPLGCVLTLPATGSEMNPSAVISRTSTAEKFAFASPLVYPEFSILDPKTTFSLPLKQVANGIVDAFVHVLEQYMTYPAGAPLQDRLAESILLTLIEEGPKTMADPADYDSRANMMWCTTMALNGIISCGVPEDWATHIIGHELTALYGIDHARTLAVVTPSLMTVLREDKREKLLQYADRVWGLMGEDDNARIDGAIEKTAAFFEQLGIPSRLSDWSVATPETPSIVAERLSTRSVVALGERGTITAGHVQEILTHSMTR